MAGRVHFGARSTERRASYHNDWLENPENSQNAMLQLSRAGVRPSSLHLTRILNPEGIVFSSPGSRGTSYPYRSPKVIQRRRGEPLGVLPAAAGE